MLKDRETKESGCSWQKLLTFGCARHKLMTHYVHTGTVRDRAARHASRYDRENEAVLLCWHTYVNAFARRYGLSACTINNQQCGPPLRGQTMTRRHRLAYVQWARRHFIWQCVDWNRVSFSGETRFALSNAGGKMHKQALLGLLRAGKGSIWWGQFRGLGWKVGDQKTYFVVIQNDFNALYRRHLVTSCHTISALFLHIKNWSDICN